MLKASVIAAIVTSERQVLARQHSLSKPDKTGDTLPDVQS